MANESKKYAVIKLSGHQYKVEEGQEVVVDLLADDASAQVLMIVDGVEVILGNPVVEKAKVEYEVVNKEVKGEKIDVFKYKSKSRYRKKKGFRSKNTVIKITKISLTK